MKFKNSKTGDVIHVDDEVWARALIKMEGNCMQAFHYVEKQVPYTQLSNVSCNSCFVKQSCPLNGHMVALAEQYLLDMEMRRIIEA